jgi:hypothetical protein
MDLAEDLRDLGAKQIASRADLKGWYRQAKLVLDRLSTGSASELGEIPELDGITSLMQISVSRTRDIGRCKKGKSCK